MSEPMPWHLTKLKNMDYNRVDLVAEGANSQAFIKLFKNRGGNTMDVQEILAKMKPEHSSVIQKALNDAQAQLDELKKAATKKDPDGDGDGDTNKSTDPDNDPVEKVLKSITDPSLKALMETQINKAKAAEAMILKMKEEKDEQEAISKAKELTGLGAEEAKLADVYKKLKNTDPALCDDVFGILKSAQALASSSTAFKEVGKSAEGKAGGLDEAAAWGQIEAAAAEISKSSGISKSAAITKAIQENPDLYAEYLRAQQQ